VENFVNVDEETPMNDTIEKNGILAISLKIAHSTSRNSENRKNIEKSVKIAHSNIEKRKQTGQSTIYRLHYC